MRALLSVAFKDFLQELMNIFCSFSREHFLFCGFRFHRRCFKAKQGAL